MITLTTLPIRSAMHHWRGNVPVLLGVAVATMTLTGALLIGDSLRGSLQERAFGQLNGIEAAYIGPRFVREPAADALPGAVPALILTASTRSEQTQINRTTIYGLSPAGFARFGLPEPGDGVVLSAPAASTLNAKVGDSVSLNIEKLSAVPRSSLLGRRGLDDVTDRLGLKVSAILPAEHPANRLAFTASPNVPVPVFVPLQILQTRLDRPGKVNALLLDSNENLEAMNANWHRTLDLTDWGLRAEEAPTRKAYLSVESEALVLDPATARAVESAAAQVQAQSAATIAYLANALTADTEPLPNDDVGKGRRLLAYSVIAGADLTAPEPLGPFLPTDGEPLADDEIVLTDWPDSPLSGLPEGHPVTVHFFKPELDADIEQTEATFRFRGTVPLAGVAADPDLTPPFPGVTDKATIAGWNLPFPLNNRRITPADEAFWETHKATPKAYISRAAAEKLFGSRFGAVTSIRVAPPERSVSLAEFREQFARTLLNELDPSSAGLQIADIRAQMLAASRGGTNFSVLFLAFSGLLILAALLLVGLLYRLLVERRVREVGLLLAVGFSPAQVLQVLLAEGAAVALVGVSVGVPLAAGYAASMLAFLTQLWPDESVAGYLTLHVTGLSLALGAILTLAVAVGTLVLSLRGIRRIPPPLLLRGVIQTRTINAEPISRSTWFWFMAGTGVVVAAGLLLLGGQFSNPDYRAGSFFGGGLLLLLVGLLSGRTLLKRFAASTQARTSLTGVGVRGAARQLGRSLLTATLVALATFLVVSVESFRRKPDAEFATRAGGSGGFQLLAEAAVPLARPFDSGPGREDLSERFEKRFQARPAVERTELLDQAERDLEGMHAIGLRLQGGDDASCLNLYQAGRPRVAGVPDALLERGAFRFGDTLAKTDSERANPWLLLNQPLPPDANGVAPIPVIAEQNTALFMLKTGVGGAVTLTDEAGRAVPGRIVALLQDSVFQSEVLIADAAFRQLYPRQEGYKLFLIETPGSPETVATQLEIALEPNGLVVTTTRAIVARYQAVVGAYLSTFQLLGAFALLLAILGLGVIVLRSVSERVGEFALLRAVGYPHSAVRTLTLAEVGVALMFGLGVGTVAAIASVLPNFALGGSVPVRATLILASAVAVTGAGVALLAVRQVVRLPVVTALRRE